MPRLGVNCAALVGRASPAVDLSGEDELLSLESLLSLSLVTWARGTNVVLSGSDVTSMVDRVASGVGQRAVNSAHAFAVTSAAKPTLVTDFAGTLPAVRLAGSTALQSNIAASNWKARHDGTSWLEYVVYRRHATGGTTQALVTSRPGGVAPGAKVFSSSGGMTLYVTNAADATVVLQSVSSAYAVGTASFFEWSYVSSRSPSNTRIQASLKTTSAFSVDQSATPASGSPSGSLVIGAHAANGLSEGASVDVAEYLGGVYSDALKTAVRRYLFLRYGLS